MPLKALLITSPSRTKNKFWTCSITSPVGSLMPPCDLASIAAVLRRDGIEPRILDLRFFDSPMAALDSLITEFRPDAVITNLATATAREDLPMLEALRNRVSRIIVFNFHAMALPEEAFAHGATHVLVGDPEYAVTAAVRGDSVPEKGLWTPGACSTPPGWIKNLDELPFPALDLLDLDACHSLIMGRERYAILLATRGCSYACPYCVIPFLFGERVRTPSVTRILAEIEDNIQKHSIRTFFFIDSAMNLNQAWLQEFCQEIVRRKLSIRWCGNMRVQPVSQELLDLMKRAGCFRVFFGVEDLDHVKDLKRKTTREATMKAFQLARKAGIETVAFFILFPDFDQSGPAMVRRFVRTALELGTDALQCNLAVPYPGSSLFDEHRKAAPPSTVFDWSRFDPAGNTPPYESKLDLVKIRQEVYLRFFLSRPSSIWRTFRQTDLRSIWTFLVNALQVLWGKQLSGS